MGKLCVQKDNKRFELMRLAQNLDEEYLEITVQLLRLVSGSPIRLVSRTISFLENGLVILGVDPESVLGQNLKTEPLYRDKIIPSKKKSRSPAARRKKIFL